MSLAYWRALPPMPITMADAMKLPEYSATNPTGVTVGKTWRRHNGAWDEAFVQRGGIPRWVIVRYEDAPNGRRRVHDPTGKQQWVWEDCEMCKIVTYRPVVRVKMGKG